jgi:hypothetical protein
MYVDSLMMAEMVAETRRSVKNKFVVQWLVVKTYICKATEWNMYNIE